MHARKELKKNRVIIVSSPQRVQQAESFRRAFKNRFKAYLVFSGEYHYNGEGLKYPKYYVVRLAEKDEPLIEGHEMRVSGGELLESITEVKRVWKAA